MRGEFLLTLYENGSGWLSVRARFDIAGQGQPVKGKISAELTNLSCTTALDIHFATPIRDVASQNSKSKNSLLATPGMVGHIEHS